MVSCRKLRKRDVTKFRVQLCIAMFAMLLVFVTGIQQTSVKAGCVLVSVLIHYFTLVTVMWMGAEALLMFQKLVIVFVRITPRYIVIVSLICWCKYIQIVVQSLAFQVLYLSLHTVAPILLVIIPAAVNPDYVIIESEDNNKGL